jgi:hypothetical protein
VAKRALWLLCASLTVLLIAMPATGDAASSLGMSYVRTPDALFVYYDPLAYIVPRTAGAFTNMLDWQRRTLGWVPDGSTMFLLRDFADYGAGAAVPAPYKTMCLDIEPVSHAFETFPANDASLKWAVELASLISADSLPAKTACKLYSILILVQFTMLFCKVFIICTTLVSRYNLMRSSTSVRSRW